MTTPEPRTSRGWLLPRWIWVYLLLAFLPVLVWVTLLKSTRILAAVEPVGPLAFADQIRSDLAWPIGVLLGTTTALVTLRWLAARAGGRWGHRTALRRLATWPVLVVGQLLAVITGVFAQLNTLFIASTGSNLGLGRIRQYFDNYAEVSAVVAKEMDPQLPLQLSVVAGLLVIIPPVAAWLARRTVLSASPRPPRPSRRAGYARAALTAVAALGLVYSATIPALTSPAYLSRDGLVNLGVGELTEARYASAEAAPVTAPVAPTGTYLTPTKTTDKRNVVMIFMESIRASATTMYNPDLDTTPYLNSIKGKTLFADNAYVVVPHTSKALTAANCGIDPPLDTTNSEANPSGLPARCLPQLLGDVGYDTSFYQSATYNFERRPELVHNFGYQTFKAEEQMDHTGFSEVNYFGYEDDIQLGPTRQLLAQHKASKQPFLATYLTVTTHHDYRLPADYPLQSFSADPQENLYLNGVRYTDSFIEKLIEEYKRAGLYDNTIFVIMADHGEGFGEHGLLQHDNTIYNEGTHIPFMILDPQGTPRRITEPIQTTSLLPTVTDLLGYRIGGGAYPSPSLLSADLSGRVKISCFLQAECLALVDGDKKYIYHFGNRPDEYFDLTTDPLEEHNIIKSQPKALIASLRAELLAWPRTNAALYEQRQPPSTVRTPGPR